MIEQKSIFKIALLHLIAILFTIINLSNIKIAGLGYALPMFDLMIIFYFSVFKNYFGVWFLFLLGIWSDSLNGSPLGTTSLCYILLTKLFILTNSKMLIRENFNQIWQQFIVFCFLFLSVKWIIVSVFNNNASSLIIPLIQLLASSLFYVVMHKFFDYLSTKLIGE